MFLEVERFVIDYCVSFSLFDDVFVIMLEEMHLILQLCSNIEAVDFQTLFITVATSLRYKLKEKEAIGL